MELKNAPKGIDVSVYQGKIDWKAVEASGLAQFVYIRASIGLAADSLFKRNWEEAGATSLRRGAYHFYRTDCDPVKQAEKFFEVVGSLQDTDMPPVLDFEVKRPANKDVKAFVKDIVAFLKKVEELFERKCVVYTGGPLFNTETQGADADDVDLLSSRDLWLAAYVFEPEKFVPSAWKKKNKSWTLWQMSGDVAAGNKPGMRIPGISAVVDYNCAQGEATDLDEWIRSSYLKQPEPVVQPEQHESVSPVEPVEQPQQEVQTQEIVETPIEVAPPVEALAVSPGPSGILGFIQLILSLISKIFGRG